MYYLARNMAKPFEVNSSYTQGIFSLQMIAFDITLRKITSDFSFALSCVLRPGLIIQNGAMLSARDLGINYTQIFHSYRQRGSLTHLIGPPCQQKYCGFKPQQDFPPAEYTGCISAENIISVEHIIRIVTLLAQKTDYTPLSHWMNLHCSLAARPLVLVGISS